MKSKMVRKSLKLSTEEWENLKVLAEEFSILAPTGPTVGQSSWGTMMKEIAKGNIRILLKDQRLIDRVKERAGA